MSLEFVLFKTSVRQSSVPMQWHRIRWNLRFDVPFKNITRWVSVCVEAKHTEALLAQLFLKGRIPFRLLIVKTNGTQNKTCYFSLTPLSTVISPPIVSQLHFHLAQFPPIFSLLPPNHPPTPPTLHMISLFTNEPSSYFISWMIRSIIPFSDLSC